MNGFTRCLPEWKPFTVLQTRVLNYNKIIKEQGMSLQQYFVYNNFV